MLNGKVRAMDTIILYIIAVVLIVVSAFRDKVKTKKAVMKGLKSIEGILPQLIVVLIGIAVILALFDAETISQYLGSGSGLPGVLIAGLVGSITLIPGFVAFPAAGELLRNGAGVLQVATFVSSLMMVGVVTLPMEIKYFGRRAAITRNIVAFAFSFVAALFVAWVVSL